MTEQEFKTKRDRLKESVRKDGLPTAENGARIVANDDLGSEGAWLLDMRPIFLNTESLNLVIDLFWHYFEKELPFQIGGQEMAAVPLVAGIVGRGRGEQPLHGFMIRKSRKWTGLQKIIEGGLSPEKVILVDDVVNSASNLKKQIEIVEREGGRVDSVFVIVRYRNEAFYDFLKEKNIRLIHLFDLADFGLSMGEAQTPVPHHFKSIWHYRNPDPNYFYRIPKSSPVLDENNVYFGTDNHELVALDQETGQPVWKFKVGETLGRKSIFSTPAIWNDLLYFGSYDGNFYAIDKKSGELRWMFDEAEWVGSSPCVAEDLGMVFIGLEFGLFGRRGGIAALDLATGKKMWDFTMPDFVHSSPAYYPKKKVVIIGSNNNRVYLFDAKTGKLKWSFATEGEVKGSFGFDPVNNLVVFGSFDHYIYFLDIDTGEKKGAWKTGYTLFSSPLIDSGAAYMGSTDKYLYKFDLATGEVKWSTRTNGRVIANAILIDQSVYVGSTDGAFYEMDAETGKITGLFQTTERITNRAAYNPKTKRFFVPTYANEIYCLERISTPDQPAEQSPIRG